MDGSTARIRKHWKFDASEEPQHNRFPRQLQLPLICHPIEGGLATTAARPSTVVLSEPQETYELMTHSSGVGRIGFRSISFEPIAAFTLSSGWKRRSVTQLPRKPLHTKTIHNRLRWCYLLFGSQYARSMAYVSTGVSSDNSVGRIPKCCISRM